MATDNPKPIGLEAVIAALPKRPGDDRPDWFEADPFGALPFPYGACKHAYRPPRECTGCRHFVV